jgi:hypothetical protein
VWVCLYTYITNYLTVSFSSSCLVLQVPYDRPIALGRKLCRTRILRNLVGSRFSPATCTWYISQHKFFYFSNLVSRVLRCVPPRPCASKRWGPTNLWRTRFLHNFFHVRFRLPNCAEVYQQDLVTFLLVICHHKSAILCLYDRYEVRSSHLSWSHLSQFLLTFFMKSFSWLFLWKVSLDLYLQIFFPF